MKRLFLLFTMLAVIFSSKGQQLMMQRLEMVIDPSGNANVVIILKMNPHQWQVFLPALNQYPDQLQQDITRHVPGKAKEDLVQKINSRNRTISLRFKAFGVCQVNSGGKWMINTGQKNSLVQEVTKNKYLLTSLNPYHNIQQSQLIQFPIAARNITFTEDATGSTRFEFVMTTPGSAHGLLLWAGILLCMGGILWFIVCIAYIRQVWPGNPGNLS